MAPVTGRPIPARALLLTAAALVGFAGNSLLGRMALGSGSIDAASFTLVRLASGAIVLVGLAALLGGSASAPLRVGTWRGAVALFGYAACFSFAYLRLPTGTGALILFGAVQGTLILAGLVAGERPGIVEWLGLALALGGLVALLLPGLTAPDPAGAALMLLSGVAWGAYTLVGRASGTGPLLTTAGHFVRTLPLALLLSLITLGRAHRTGPGIALAVASGAIASGLGYSLWYGALRHLTATRAAVVQLVVPVLASAAGVIVLGEAITLRLGITSAAILGGVWLAVAGRARLRPRT